MPCFAFDAFIDFFASVGALGYHGATLFAMHRGDGLVFEDKVAFGVIAAAKKRPASAVSLDDITIAAFRAFDFKLAWGV